MSTRTRTRTLDNLGASTYARTWYVETGTTRSTEVYTYAPRKIVETMTDTVIDNFKERSARGEVFFNTMTKTRETTLHSPSSVVGYSTDGRLRTEGTSESVTRIKVPSLLAPNSRSTDIGARRSIAITNALSKASSSEVLLLATIGEFKETKEMLLDALRHLRHLDKLLLHYQRLLSIYKTASKRKLKGFKDRLKDLQHLYLDAENAWMQCRMGWRPFFYECRSLYEAITSEKKYPQRQTFRGKSTDLIYNLRDSVSQPAYGNTYFYNRTYHETTTFSAGSLFEQRVNGFPDVYGLTKIPQTIWELSKLSWFVDYFFNIGEAIAACTPDSFWRPLGSWNVTNSVQIYHVELTGITQGGWVWSTSGGARTIIVETKQRTTGSSVGVHFRPKLNWAKYIDSVAVCRQQLQKTLQLVRQTKRR